MNKFRNKKQLYAGYSFASALELDLFMELCLQQKCGIIKNIEVQQSVYLTDARIQYIADFKAYDCELQEDVYYEAKGIELPQWRIKRRLWIYYGPSRLRIYKRRGKRDIYLDEEIIPKSGPKSIGCGDS